MISLFQPYRKCTFSTFFADDRALSFSLVETDCIDSLPRAYLYYLPATPPQLISFLVISPRRSLHFTSPCEPCKVSLSSLRAYYINAIGAIFLATFHCFSNSYYPYTFTLMILSSRLICFIDIQLTN